MAGLSEYEGAAGLLCPSSPLPSLLTARRKKNNRNDVNPMFPNFYVSGYEPAAGKCRLIKRSDDSKRFGQAIRIGLPANDDGGVQHHIAGSPRPARQNAKAPDVVRHPEERSR